MPKPSELSIRCTISVGAVPLKFAAGLKRTLVPEPISRALPVETLPTVEGPSREAFAQLAPTPPVGPAASAVVPRKVASRHHARTRAPVRRIASVQPMESRAVFPFAW